MIYRTNIIQYILYVVNKSVFMYIWRYVGLFSCLLLQATERFHVQYSETPLFAGVPVLSNLRVSLLILVGFSTKGNIATFSVRILKSSWSPEFWRVNRKNDKNSARLLWTGFSGFFQFFFLLRIFPLINVEGSSNFVGFGWKQLVQ